MAIVSEYGRWLAKSKVPKLFVNADPGVMLTGHLRDLVRTWPNLIEVTVPGLHFLQEDEPDAIGKALQSWIAEIDA